MSRTEPLAVYSFPFEEGCRLPVCLALFSPYALVEPLQDLLAVFTDLEAAEEIIFRLQVFPQRVEIHMTGLSYESALRVVEFLTTRSFSSLGEWAFIASELGTCEI